VWGQNLTFFLKWREKKILRLRKNCLRKNWSEVQLMPEENQLGTGISVIFEKKVEVNSRAGQYCSNLLALRNVRLSILS